MRDPGIVDVRLVREPLLLADLPSDVQAAVQTYLAAADAFTPGAESTLRVELPQLAIAAALLHALKLPTLDDLFDRAIAGETRREPATAQLSKRQGAKRA